MKIGFDNKKASYIICSALVIVNAFRGFIDNLFNHGTLLLDLIIWILCGLVIAKKKVGFKRQHKIFIYYIVWIGLCLFDLVFQLLLDRTDLRNGILGFRNDVFYTLPFLLFFILLGRDDCKKIFSLIVGTIFFISFFAIIQYIGRHNLPDSLLFLGESDGFGLYGLDVIRVNGLVGNPIIFGGFVLFLTSFSWAKIILNEGNMETYLQLIVSIIANYFTFSRASNAGILIVMASEYLIVPKKRSRKNIINTFFSILMIFGSAVLLLSIYNQTLDGIVNKIQNSVVYQRLFDSESVWNIGSDNVHRATIQDAIDTIRKYPIIGYGVGTVGYSSSLGINGIIRDGTFWAYLLEWGIPICIFYWFIVGKTIFESIKIVIKKNGFESYVCLGYIGANLYLIISSFINSAYSARSVLVLNWMVAGLIYVMINDKSSFKSKKNYNFPEN